MMTLKHYILNEQIKDFEDSSIEELPSLVDRLEKFTYYTKPNGKSFYFGVADKRFFSSIDNKKFNSSFTDYKNNWSTDVYKSLHIALESICLSLNKNFLIYSEFFDDIYSNNYYDIAQNKLILIEELGNNRDILDRLNNENVNASLEIHDTTDGQTLSKISKNVSWSITKSKNQQVSELSSVNQIKRYLDQPNEIASEILNKDYNNLQTLKNRSRDLTDERDSIRSELLRLKEKLKDEIISKSKNVVALDKDIIWSFNKKKSTISKYDIKNSISGNQLTTDEFSSLENKGGLYGIINYRINSLFSVEGLESNRKIKEVLSAFKKETPNKTVISFANNLKNLSYNSTKRKIEAILISGLEELEKTRLKYIEKTNQFNSFSYTQKIDKNDLNAIKETLLTIADTNNKLINKLLRIKKTKSIAQLIAVLFGSKIIQMHQNDTE